MPARILLSALFSFAILYGVAASAATYVSDQLSINMRGGPGYSYSINELVDAGTQVTVLATSDGWTKVRTPEGEVGYVLSRLLTDQPAAWTQVQDLKDRVAKLEATNKDLRSELSEALGGAKKLGKLKRQLVAENEKLKSQLASIKRAASHAVNLRKENQHYREKILSMQSTIENLRHENKALQSRRDGMKIGAFILIVGIIVGLVLPMFRRRKRNTWDSL